MTRVTDFLHRVQERIGWIMGTVRLSANLSSGVKLLLGGLWFFVNDSWKSGLRFTAEIEQFGRSLPFRFEDMGDFGLFCELFRSGAYEGFWPEKADVIFDLGANVGVAALYFRLRYPGATIHCFEPDPENVRRLRLQAAVLGDVRIHEEALWSSKGTLNFYIDPHRGSCSSVWPASGRQRTVQVQTRTLDSVLEEENIEVVDLLKFDIEGAEEEVLTASDRLGQIHVLYGELHADLCDAGAVLKTLNAHFDVVETTPMAVEQRSYVTARVIQE